ncbi:hypothetical protein KM043_004449 [Ampulex compressa]|nr:hypothetical protein KM043_004449 [Ampulex compressa]
MEIYAALRIDSLKSRRVHGESVLLQEPELLRPRTSPLISAKNAAVPMFGEYRARARAEMLREAAGRYGYSPLYGIGFDRKKKKAPVLPKIRRGRPTRKSNAIWKHESSKARVPFGHSSPKVRGDR